MVVDSLVALKRRDERKRMAGSDSTGEPKDIRARDRRAREEFRGVFARRNDRALRIESIDRMSGSTTNTTSCHCSSTASPAKVARPGAGRRDADQGRARGPVRLRPQRRALADGGGPAQQAGRGAGTRSHRRARTRPRRSTRRRSRRCPRWASTSPRSSRSRSPTSSSRAADAVITMGCGDACPIYPGKRYEDWELEDPEGKDLETVRRIRDDLDERVRGLLGELTGTDSPRS